MKNNKVLSILIPTRNRAKFLDGTLTRIIRAISFANAEKLVDIVIVNNFSSDNTEKVAKEWVKKHDFIKYFHHKNNYQSGEESLLNGTQYCQSDYIWGFGDDDFMKTYAIKELLNLINKAPHLGFILLNSDILNPSGSVSRYMRASYDVLEYKNGQSLFSNFGFISPTTTISCLVFKKEFIDLDFYKKISEISPIYSHSFSLFYFFCKEPAAFLSIPAIVYKANRAEDELNSMTGIGVRQKKFKLFAFSSALIEMTKLICAEGKLAKISPKNIYFSYEIEYSKEAHSVKHSILAFWILRNYCYQMRWILGESFFKRVFMAKRISEFCKELQVAIDMFDILGVKCFFQSIKKKRFNIFYVIFIRRIIKRTLKKLEILINHYEGKNVKVLDSLNSKNSPSLITRSNIPFKKVDVSASYNLEMSKTQAKIGRYLWAITRKL